MHHITKKEVISSEYILPMTLKEKKTYDSWRIRILLSIIVGYSTYYLCRQNFSMILPAITEEYQYSKMQLGSVITYASIVYSIGKFINGYISDQSNARYFMTIGLGASSLVTFLLGFSNSLSCLGLLWMFNSWFQSMGWPPSARMLTHWFAPNELGMKWALSTASNQIGGAVTLILSGYLITEYGWRYAFFVPSVIAFCITIVLFNRLRDSPKELGLPPVEVYKGCIYLEENKYEYKGDKLTAIQIYTKVFTNKKLWYICCANICVCIIRIGIIFWSPLLLQEFKGLNLTYAGWQIAACEITGLLGGVVAGWISDRMSGQRVPVGCFFMVCLSCTLLLFCLIPTEHTVLSTFILILIGFFAYGPQVLIGLALADFSSKQAIGTATGLVGSMGYLGSGLSGICVGYLIDNYKWKGAFVFFVITAIFGVLFFIVTWYYIYQEQNILKKRVRQESY